MNFSRANRARRARFCFYALLAKAGFSARANHRFTTVMRQGSWSRRSTAADAGVTIVSAGGRGRVCVEGTEALQAVVDWLMDAKENEMRSDRLA